MKRIYKLEDLPRIFDLKSKLIGAKHHFDVTAMANFGMAGALSLTPDIDPIGARSTSLNFDDPNARKITNLSVPRLTATVGVVTESDEHSDNEQESEQI